MNNTATLMETAEKVASAVIAAVQETQLSPASHVEAFHANILREARMLAEKFSGEKFGYKLVWRAVAIASADVYDVNRTFENEFKWENAGLKAAGIE